MSDRTFFPLSRSSSALIFFPKTNEMNDTSNPPRSSTTSTYNEQRVLRGKSILDRNLNKSRGTEASTNGKGLIG